MKSPQVGRKTRREPTPSRHVIGLLMHVIGIRFNVRFQVNIRVSTSDSVRPGVSVSVNFSVAVR